MPIGLVGPLWPPISSAERSWFGTSYKSSKLEMDRECSWWWSRWNAGHILRSVSETQRDSLRMRHRMLARSIWYYWETLEGAGGRGSSRVEAWPGHIRLSVADDAQDHQMNGEGTFEFWILWYLTGRRFDLVAVDTTIVKVKKKKQINRNMMQYRPFHRTNGVPGLNNVWKK